MTVTDNAYNKNLQTPLSLGKLSLKNRILMASLTRSRGVVPDALNAEYYKQRSSGGLIFSEGILIEKQGSEWSDVPGLYTSEQIEGWKNITDIVHAEGGLIFAQLWHLGRASHEQVNEGVPPVAPSAIRANAGKYRSLEGKPGHSTPRAIEDPKTYVQLYKTAAENAKLAGFDGVELHNAAGYLPNQFLESHSNHRTDNYGGSIENRARFSLEIIDELLKVYPKENVGIKLSPSGGYNDMGEPTQQLVLDTYGYIIQQLNQREIGYIQFMQLIPAFDPTGRGTPVDIYQLIKLIKGPKVFLNCGVKAEDADRLVKEGIIDAVVYGRDYISNPDLPERLFNNLKLAPYNPTTFYTFEENKREVGYTDYPFFSLL